MAENSETAVLETEKEARIPSELPILPIKEGVIFPSLVVPLAVTDGNQVEIDSLVFSPRGILKRKPRGPLISIQ
jgi:hypothetical protein